MKNSSSFANFSYGDKTAGGNSYQNGPDFNSTEFKAQKEDFFSKKQTENAMRRDDLPPSQGGKYAGFGSCPNQPQNQGSGYQDYASSVASGLTSSLSAFSLNASSLTGKLAETGWKFTSLASQKAGELSETVTEKVKEGKILEDLSSSASSLAGKVTEVVGKKNFDLTSLWGQHRALDRSDYQPCEDSGLLYSNTTGMSGYQDTLLSDRSPTTGREQDSQGFGGFQSESQGFGGFQNSDSGFRSQKSPSRKDSDDWGSGWNDEGWSDSPKQTKRPEKPKPSPNAKKTKSKEKKEVQEKLLIDFGDSGEKEEKKQDDNWGWEDDGWESLNKND